MKRLISPLVWLCAVCAVALSVLTIVDPTGVYAGYAAALPPGTPRIAAAFTAAQDGVYPWTVFAADEPAVSPAYRPLTGTVTNEEMRSSVGDEEPFRAPAHDGSVAVELTPSVEIVSREADEPKSDAPAESSAAAPQSGFVTVDLGWFDDALFIGDSHTEGLCDYGGIKNATFYYKRGLDIWSVMKKAFVGGSQTIPQALSSRQFGKIYIMLGINEIGCGTTESFAAQYASVVAQLRELQPDALIYIQSIFHTSQKKSDTSAYNNTAINARNAAISAIADGEHVFFVDCNAVFDDENGALTPSYSGDGVHVKAPYYAMWRDYLLRFGRAGAPAVESPAEPALPGADVPQPSGTNGVPAAIETAEPGGNPAAVEPAPAPEPETPAEPVPAPAVTPDAPPAEPVAPAEPEEPSEPEEPTEPEEPEVPAEPTEPTDPDEPGDGPVVDPGEEPRNGADGGAA